MAASKKGWQVRKIGREVPSGVLETARLHRMPLLGSLPVRLSHPLLPSPVGRGHWVSHSHILHSVAHVETPRLGLAAMPFVATHCVLGQAVYGILWLPLRGTGRPPTHCCPAGGHGSLEEPEAVRRRNWASEMHGVPPNVPREKAKLLWACPGLTPKAFNQKEAGRFWGKCLQKGSPPSSR